MKSYKQYNESVRDMMTPKSEEDIKNAILRLDKKELEGRISILFHQRNFGEIRDMINMGINGEVLNGLLRNSVPSHQTEMLKLALDNGADVNTDDDFPLRASIYNNHVDMFIELIEHGANFERALISLKEENEKNNMMDNKLIDKYTKIYHKMNESVRDQMTPKSEEDIIKSLDKLSPDEKLKVGVDNSIEWIVKQALEEGATVSCHNMNKAGTLDNLNIYYIMSKHLNRLNKKDFDYYDNLHNKMSESVRDQMTPKSKEDIKKSLDNISKKNRYHLLGAKLKKACVNSQLDDAEELLKMGADSNYDTDETMHPSGWDSISLACLSQDVECIRLLLRYGAKVRPLHFRLSHVDGTNGDKEKEKEIIKLLNQHTFKGKFKQFIGMNEGVRDFMTPKSQKDINRNIKHMNLNIKNKLMLEFIREENLEMILVMTNSGLKVTPYMIKIASIHHRLSAISLLRYIKEKQKEKLNEGIRDLMTPKSEEDVRRAFEKLDSYSKLINGIKAGVMWAVKEAISEGADIHTATDQPLLVAIDCKNMEAVKLLLSLGADVHGGNELNLRDACRTRNIELIRLLLDHGADLNVAINHKRKWGYVWAPEVDKVLKEYDNAKNKIKRFFSFNESVRDLMTPKSEEDIMKLDFDSVNPLQKFAIGVNYEMIWLVKQAIEQNPSVIHSGYLYIINAVNNDDEKMVKFLIDAGMEVSINNEQPLRQAILHNNVEITKLLVLAGANKDNEYVQDLCDECEGEEAWEFVCNFNKIDESVKDMMTPKSKEELDVPMRKLFKEDPIQFFYKYHMTYSEMNVIFSEEEIRSVMDKFTESLSWAIVNINSEELKEVIWYLYKNFLEIFLNIIFLITNEFLQTLIY